MTRLIENIAFIVLAVILIAVVILFLWPTPGPSGGAIGTAVPWP
jgi:hypothetical protein